MPHETIHNSITRIHQAARTADGITFTGFAPPTSNTTFTPNQFFDVVLPNASRGCIRIVAYLLRKTLGWCDANGNPQREQIAISNSELERRAGVGHDMIRSALNEALALHFIECVNAGQSASKGDPGKTAVYALKWDAAPHYARTIEDFRGFYEGAGHRTDIPNQFFDYIIRTETVSVINVVGAVIRYSIGFVAKHGQRRQHATLAYSQILKVSGLSSRRTLAAAIREAIAKRYIVCLDAGKFSVNVSERRSATYAVCWSDGFHLTPPVPEGTPKRIPMELGKKPSEKDTSPALQHSEKDTRTTPKRIPAEHSEKDTIETKPLNETLKQQNPVAELLRKEGFSAQTAASLAQKFSATLIQQQIEWLPLRNATKSRAGLLRRAIEGNWPAPGKDTASIQPAYPTAYLDWLRAEHQAIRSSSPEDYSRFLAKRERRRSDLAQEWMTSRRQQLLADFDTESSLLIDLQKFFALPGPEHWAHH